MRSSLLPLALFASLVAASCVGPNNAFNGVAAWNTRVTNSKWGNELIYIGLWIVPVYEIAYAADGLIFNSFEFWGGTNPIGTPGEFENQGKQ
jgi:hypothetical protein